jgi:Transposase, Mutator family
VFERTMDVRDWLRKKLEDAHADADVVSAPATASARQSGSTDATLPAARLGHKGQLGRARRAEAARGKLFPDWLLQPRRRAEQAFVSVIVDAYLAGISTRRVEKLVQQLGGA